MAPTDPLYNSRDAASRDLIRFNIITDLFRNQLPADGLAQTVGSNQCSIPGHRD